MDTVELLEPALVLDRLGSTAALSHQTAARRHGLDLIDNGGEHVTVGRNISRRTEPGWHVHRRDVRPDDVVVLDGCRVTSALRTVHDLARVLPLGAALATAESALRHRAVLTADLRARLTASRGAWASGPATVGRLVTRSDSVLESLAAALFHQAGLPPPRRQYDVSECDGALVARVDFCWPGARLVVEVDGFAFHSDRAAYRRDRERGNDLERLGWRVLRFSWEDVVSRPLQVAAMIGSCLAQ